MKIVVTLLAALAVAPTVGASSGRPADIPERARGSEMVVVGTVADVHSSFRRNAAGDQLIVSRAVVKVEETLKGKAAVAFVEVDIEGGTVGDLTLTVSDMPSVTAGERAAFFLTRGEAGAHVPHLRGLGVLKLDKSDRVPGSSLTLEQIRLKVDGSAQSSVR